MGLISRTEQIHNRFIELAGEEYTEDWRKAIFENIKLLSTELEHFQIAASLALNGIVTGRIHSDIFTETEIKIGLQQVLEITK
ncbi:hypothetical protein [Paenibacillus alginolyticus]|uniref:TetR family transcriptional regulator n=1 Tax=Paenibacillus alginolyticus TaxID=59839 RepID=A0ABT4GJR6_9BACL|nr:hypothetical protein [Paenibacillus alginolyticus]MCY9696431.1 hypothetical protein [Paenibacillus alginolyticus]MEC0145254.1 hypothetical protein [Paenibacillus alginolyticus]